MLPGAAILLFACAAPQIRIAPRFVTGEVRQYRLTSEAETRISATGFSSTETTRLDAITRIEVQESTLAGSVLLLTITPRRLTRNGETAEPPPEQRIRIEVEPGGTVKRVTTAEGTQELEAEELEDLAPLIGPPLPPGPVHLADRWTRTARSLEGTSPGVQRVRLAALRVVDGYNCAVLALSTRRAVARQRTVGGRALTLQGVEYAAGEITFAFREGFPVTVRSNGEARLAIAGEEAAGGAVVIKTETALTLVRRSGVG